MLQLVARLSVILFLVSSAALAQAPSPAQMGVTSGTTPEILQTQDNTGTWVPMGAINPTTHSFSAFNANGLDVRTIGMKPGGQDNSPYVAALMNAVTSVNSESSGLDVFFPATPGQIYTDYIFGSSFHVTRHMNIRCQGSPNGGGDATTRLIFPPGVHGLVFDNAGTAPPGGGSFGGGGVSNCGIISSGYHEGFQMVSGSNVLTSVANDKFTSAWDFQVGDGIIAYDFTPTNSAPFSPAGTVITAVNSGTQTLTLSSPTAAPRTGNGNSLWRLPVADAFTGQITSGSHTVTITGGPSLLQPGDYVWSTAFPLGTTVRSVSGTLGNQTVNMTAYTLEGDNYQNATATQSPGKLWIIPAALKTFVQTSLHNNYIATFPWGLEMECSAWGVPVAGCNGSFASENIFQFDMIGRLVIGDNAGASASLMNVYAQASIADIAEMGAVGSVYLGDNANSQEDSTSLYGIIGACVNSNSSSFFGNYAPTNGGYCMNGIGVATSPGGRVMFVGPIAGAPTGAPSTYNGEFHNRWFFNNDDPHSTQLCMNSAADIVLAWSRSGQSCGGSVTWTLNYGPAAVGYWAFEFTGFAGGEPMNFTEGSLGAYPGYTAGNLALMSFPTGFLLYDAETGGSAPGPERLLDAGLSIPTASFHKQGDVHFNLSAAPGGVAGWIDTGAGASGFRQFGRVANDTAGTSWPVASPVVIASLVACSGSTVGFGVVTNGVAVGTAGYGAAVSTTGAVTRPVFCDGTSWTYH